MNIIRVGLRPTTTSQRWLVPATFFWYALEVYVDDFISIVIPRSQEQLRHVANAIMEGIHDIFLPDNDDANDPLSEKKLLKREG